MLFARELAESGRHVYLIGLTTGASSLEREVYRSGGVLEINRIHTPPYNKSRNIERLLWTFRTNFRLIRAVMGNPASHNADVLFTGAPPFMLFFAVALKVSRKARLTYRITDFYPEVIIADLGKTHFSAPAVRAAHMVHHLFGLDHVRPGEDEQRLAFADLAFRKGRSCRAGVALASRCAAADEAGEQRVRRQRLALELGVELAADEVRVVGAARSSRPG